MSETETERAIEYFEKKKSETEYKIEMGFGDYGDKESIKLLDTAISALRNQSEAERKVEKVREYCKQIRECEFASLRNADALSSKDIIDDIENLLDGSEILEGN